MDTIRTTAIKEKLPVKDRTFLVILQEKPIRQVALILNTLTRHAEKNSKDEGK
jgi:hypothetical protein